MAWYAAHTHAGAESRALWHLEHQGFSVYLPRYLKRRRHARRTDWVQTPLFPRYLFVWLDAFSERWQAIQSTIGVGHLICSNGSPLAVPEQIVQELREREDDKGLIRMAEQQPFHRGDKVQVLRGALVDQVGIFECASGDERAIVLLSLLGRDVRVQVPEVALSKA